MIGKWKLVSQRVDEDDAHHGQDDRAVVAVVEGVADGGEVRPFLLGLFAEGEEVGGGEGEAGELGELEHHGKEPEGGLLDQKSDEEIGALDDVEILEKGLEVGEVHGDGLVHVVAGGDGQAGNQEHVDEHVGKFPVHDAAVVEGDAGSGLEGGWLGH